MTPVHPQGYPGLLREKLATLNDLLGFDFFALDADGPVTYRLTMDEGNALVARGTADTLIPIVRALIVARKLI